MKKLLIALVVALGLAVAVPVSAVAPVSAATMVDVSGTVTINGVAGNHARVIVSCNGHSKGTRADASGFYSVQFKQTDCQAGSTIYVTAKKGNKGGTTVTTADSDGSTHADVNVTTTSVPEFTPVAGLGTAVVAGGGLLVMRRRQLAQQA